MLKLPSHWRRVDANPASPEGRIGHTLCVDDTGDYVYLYGGVNDNEDGSSKYLGDLYRFDFRNKLWTQADIGGQKQQPRAFHTAAFYNNRIYIFGGCNGKGRFNRLFYLETNGNCSLVDRNAVDVPATRYCHSAVIFEKKMYIFAGKCGGRNSNKRLDDLWSFDFQSETFRQEAQEGVKPSSRSAHAAFTYGRQMIVFGGRSEQGECCDDLFSYGFDNKLWRKIDTTQSLFGRARHSVVVHNSNVVVFGGWNGRRKLSDLFFYHMDSETFEQGADTDDSGPSRRECHVAVMCKNTMVIFGGRFKSDYMSDTCELDLGPSSLKEMCRDWLMNKIRPLPGSALPQRLVDFFKRWSDFHTPQPPLLAAGRGSLRPDGSAARVQ